MRGTPYVAIPLPKHFVPGYPSVCFFLTLALIFSLQKSLDSSNTFKQRLEKLAMQSLDRAEELKTEQTLNSLSDLDISKLLSKQNSSQPSLPKARNSQESSKFHLATLFDFQKYNQLFKNRFRKPNLRCFFLQYHENFSWC